MELERYTAIAMSMKAVFKDKENQDPPHVAVKTSTVYEMFYFNCYHRRVFD